MTSPLQPSQGDDPGERIVDAELPENEAVSPAQNDAELVTSATEQTVLNGKELSALKGSPGSEESTTWMVPEQFGRYKILQELGRGGMGAVFLALDTQLDRNVALKIPLLSDDDSGAVERFYREARAMATLQHANLCQVYDVNQFERWHFLTMAYIEGEPLSKILRKQGALSPVQGLTLLRTVALALQKAHDAGIIHRDLKPANIMLTADHEPVIMDFGLARLSKVGESELTQLGAVMGSPAYMAPEQVEARHAEIGPATDVYALGVILYQLLTGRRPFEGSTAAIFGQIVTKVPDPPSKYLNQLPTEVDSVCLKAMSKAPSERYPTASAFADELARLIPLCSGVSPLIRRADANAGGADQNAASIHGPGLGSRTSRRDAELRQVTVAHFNFEADENSVSASSASHSEFLHEQSQMFDSFVGNQIERLGGVVVSSSGQEVIACFGFPQAFEDASQRAVRAALHFMRQLSESAQRKGSLPAPGQAWVTIHSGEAIAEQSSEPEGSEVALVGEARNTATRLNAMAEPGDILISAATHQRVALYFECESLGVQRVRGISQPIELFKVTREAASRNRVELVDPGNLTPLIGRDTELAVLKDRWEQAAEELGQVVLLIGDAGLGKSRLIREIREHIANTAEDDDPAIVEFRCSQYHSDAAFFPAIEYLSRLFDFEHITAAADRLASIERYLEELRLVSPANVSLMAGLLSVEMDGRYPDLDLAPQRRKELTEDLLRNWLRSLSKHRPVVFIVEDLHWIDPTTMDFVKEHVEDFEIGKLLTILTFRPEFQTPWGSLPHQTQIALNRLTKRQIAEVMKRITKRREIPPEVLQEIIDRTDGVPLFIEEFTHLVMESGMLDGGSEAAAQLHTRIPATLQDLLLSRLDRMESNRDVVQLAAAIGREFPYALLAASCDLSEKELDEELDKLVHAEVLFQKGRYPESHFIFKHALIQDSAYNALLRKKRQQFHQRIAVALEKGFPEVVSTQPDLLARHFTAAEIIDRAIHYWLKAGELARERSAHVEAIRHLTRGLELIATKPDGSERDVEELQFQMPLSASYIAVRGYAAPEVEVHIQRARELCERLGPSSPLFHVMMIIWALRFIRGQSDPAVSTSREILSLAESRDDSYRAEAYWSRTASEWWTGDFRSALELGEKGVSLYQIEASLPHAQILQQNCGPLMTSYAGWSKWMLGYPEQAWEWLGRAVALAEQLNDKFTLVATQWHYAFMTAIAGRVKENLTLTEKVLTVSEEQSYAFWTALAMGTKGSALRSSGQYTEAATLLQNAISRCDAIGAVILHGFLLGELAESLWRLDRRTEAWETLKRGLSRNDSLGQRAFEAELKRRQGMFLLEESPENATPAENCWLEAIAVAQQQKARMFGLRSSLLLANQWKRCGRVDDARQLLERVCNTFPEGVDSSDVIAARTFLASCK